MHACGTVLQIRCIQIGDGAREIVHQGAVIEFALGGNMNRHILIRGFLIRQAVSRAVSVCGAEIHHRRHIVDPGGGVGGVVAMVLARGIRAVCHHIVDILPAVLLRGDGPGRVGSRRRPQGVGGGDGGIAGAVLHQDCQLFRPRCCDAVLAEALGDGLFHGEEHQ